MGEHLADALLTASSVIRYFGKYDEANAIILCSRLIRVHGLRDLDRLEAFVERAEAAVPNESEETKP